METPLSNTYRIYKNTIQRIPSSITSLNSNACYIVDSNKKNRRYIWIGRLAKEDDKFLSMDIYEKMCKEPRPKRYHTKDKEKTDYIIFDNQDSPELIGLLSLLCGTEDEYNKHHNARLQPIINNSYKTLYFIEKNNSTFSIRKLVGVSPNANGSVPKLVFPSTPSSTSMIGLLVGDQWDLWIGEENSHEDIDNAITTLINSGKDNRDTENNDESYHRHNIKKIREGYERAPFRENFEPNIKFGYKFKKYKIVNDEADAGCINMTAIADVMNVSWMITYLEQNAFVQVKNTKNETTISKGNGIELQSFKTEQDISSVQLMDDAFEMKCHLNIDSHAMVTLLEKFKQHPSHLLGWQIDVENLGLGVVVDYHTSSYVNGRLQFALRLDKDSPEIWVALNMDNNSEEYKFKLLRNVNRNYAASNTEHVVL